MLDIPLRVNSDSDDVLGVVRATTKATGWYLEFCDLTINLVYVCAVGLTKMCDHQTIWYIRVHVRCKLMPESLIAYLLASFSGYLSVSTQKAMQFHAIGQVHNFVLFFVNFNKKGWFKFPNLLLFFFFTLFFCIAFFSLSVVMTKSFNSMKHIFWCFCYFKRLIWPCRMCEGLRKQYTYVVDR